jgi:F-type H+-transporting ATPase subunit gamma
MAKTRELVKRRKAIRNIRKITRTMELIATARFKAAVERAHKAAAYTQKIAELVRDLSATAANVHHPLLEKRDPITKSVLLVLCSNRGLCGGYNASILRVATAHLRELRDEQVEVHPELSGKRAIAAFKFQGIPAEKTYTQFEDKPSFLDVKAIADRYISEYTSGAIDQVDVAYMKFESASRQMPVVETLLPLSAASGDSQPERPAMAPVDYEFLPGAAEILEDLLPVTFRIRLYKCFLDAAVSEQIARRLTMSAATENADEIIKTLTGQYNRARQAQITKEIAEVIGGAEALR